MTVDKSGTTLVTLPPSEKLFVHFLPVGRPPWQLTRVRGFPQNSAASTAEPPASEGSLQQVTVCAISSSAQEERDFQWKTWSDLDPTVFLMLVTCSAHITENSKKKGAPARNRESPGACEMLQLAYQPAHGSDENSSGHDVCTFLCVGDKADGDHRKQTGISSGWADASATGFPKGKCSVNGLAHCRPLKV